MNFVEYSIQVRRATDERSFDHVAVLRHEIIGACKGITVRETPEQYDNHVTDDFENRYKVIPHDQLAMFHHWCRLFVQNR